MKKTLALIMMMVVVVSVYAISMDELKTKMHDQNVSMLSKIKDIYIKQKSVSSGMNVEAYQTIYAKGTKAAIENKIIYPTTMGDTIISVAKIIANEEGTRMFVPSNKSKTEEAVQTDLLSFKLSSDMMSKLIMAKDKGDVVSLIFSDYSEMIPDGATIEKTEKVEGIKCYKVKMSDNQGNTMSIWISKKDYLPVKIELSGSMNGVTQTQTTYFKKYKKIAGKMGIPYVMETYMNGNLMEKNEVVEMKVNKGIKDEVFK